jgi:hypothetical protein
VGFLGGGDFETCSGGSWLSFYPIAVECGAFWFASVAILHGVLGDSGAKSGGRLVPDKKGRVPD